MYKLHLSKNFIKDAKKLTKSDIQATMQILEKLCLSQELEPKHKDHELSGNLKGVRDCHIKPDLVLIYKRDEQDCELLALRVGKHSNIFK